MPRKFDPGMRRGTTSALQQAFNGSVADDEVHLGAWAAEADFAALRSQLNNPPQQYQGPDKCLNS